MSNDALNAAEKAQNSVEQCIDNNQSFRLEAGAGAGKTYSLVQCLKKIIFDRGQALVRANQRIACITYTDIAKQEILQEIESHEAIVVETIHSFCWSFMRHFQVTLRELVKELPDYKRKADENYSIDGKQIEYQRGYFKLHDERVELQHSHIPLLMSKLLGLVKVQRLFTQQYPVVFIDEYQDTDKFFMEALNTAFIAPKTGPLLGFFGDHWQTIYSSDYDLKDYSLASIDKEANFRSTSKIVDVLNKLRPGLNQKVRPQSYKGEARFFHTNSYDGVRRDENHFKADLPENCVVALKDTLLEKLRDEGWNEENTKVLMLTHKVIATQQGYFNLASLCDKNELFTKKEDPIISFFVDTIEPMCKAYAEQRYGFMFKILGERPTITCHEDKSIWRSEIEELNKLRTDGSVGEVLEFIAKSRMLPKSKRIGKLQKEYAELTHPEKEEKREKEFPPKFIRFKEIQKLSYSEIINLSFFLDGGTSLATQHSVKGAEYDNVLVVLSGGWNQYNWPNFFELNRSGALTQKNSKAYFRARNLFYVSVSRPKKRLAVLNTQYLHPEALAGVTSLFGEESVISLNVPNVC
ncbi:DNA helicase II [Vibrio campbellii]|uniref:UvrD-helicase domain-containing protein n=1 Tax=Vibrio campbellii TaxID=680 RepID=UPI0009BDA6EB|nr:UvrD-helicase domain-containing protein [Vibrio campbellii]OQQ03159.1 DNA helicase II [Vibrio campbellii]